MGKWAIIRWILRAVGTGITAAGVGTGISASGAGGAAAVAGAVAAGPPGWTALALVGLGAAVTALTVELPRDPWDAKKRAEMSDEHPAVKSDEPKPGTGM